MAKRSGSSRTVSLPSGSAIERLQNSSNFFIKAGMNRYAEERDNPAWDYSDMDRLTETDKTYLVAYLSHSYRVVNEALRNGELSGDIRDMVTGIDRAVGKLKSYNGTVYRGLEFDTGRPRADERSKAELLDYYKSNVGKEITERSYISSGKDQSRINRKFTSSAVPSLRFTIESKTGRDLSRYNDEEKEVVFRRNTRFKVISVRGNNIHLREL